MHHIRVKGGDRPSQAAAWSWNLPPRLLASLSSSPSLSLFSSSNQLPSMAPAAGRAIQAQLNVIISTFALVFLLPHIRGGEVSVLLIVFACFFFSLSRSVSPDLREGRDSEKKKAKAPPPPPGGNAQFGHFSPVCLAPFFSRSFNLPAEEPQCLLLTFWYRLSPSPPPSPSLAPSSSLSFLPLSAAVRLPPRHYSPSVAAGDVHRRPTLHIPASSSHYGDMIPVHTCQRGHVISA